jgi:hypothetical protein
MGDKSKVFNPLPWAVSIAILFIASSLARRPINECEPTKFEVLQYFKLEFGGCTKTQVQPIPSSVKARFYIQIADESQRDKMRLLQNTLQGKGYSVPGIENVKGKSQIPVHPNVRYFNDSDFGAANVAVLELKNLGYSSAYPYHVGNMKAPAGALEVWLSNP